MAALSGVTRLEELGLSKVQLIYDQVCMCGHVCVRVCTVGEKGEGDGGLACVVWSCYCRWSCSSV